MTDHHDNPEDARALALATEIRDLIGQVKRRLREKAGIGDLTMSQLFYAFEYAHPE